MNKKFIISLLILPATVFSFAQKDVFGNWPQGASPQEVGAKVSDHFLLSAHGAYSSTSKAHIPYFEVCNWYGALSFAKANRDDVLRNRLIDRFTPLFMQDSALIPVPDHVDYTVFGALPLEIFLQIKGKLYFELGKRFADTQWAAPVGPRVIPESYQFHDRGYTWQTRMWIDDMYMITMVQAQAYRATKEEKYIDRAAKEMVMYLDSLQKSNGLFYHAPDVPFFWGRGNGWMAAGMTELLRVLPKNNPDYARIMTGYQTMMSSLLKYQAPSGMWRQLIDDSTSWAETSSTGMFTYAMITGVKDGWLDNKVYGEAARKAWLSLITYINDKGEITEVCEGTGKKNDRQYYLDRKRIVGDMHGQAPVLWCASALIRKKD